MQIVRPQRLPLRELWADLWLEANQNAISAQRVAELLVAAFGYAGGDLHIVHQQPT